MNTYCAQLDALHARVAGPGGVVTSPDGYVLAGDGDGRLALTAGRLPADRSPEFADGLLDLHRELLTAAIGHALRHLDGRQSEGVPLLSRPQIQADLAEIATEIRLAATSTVDGQVRWARYRQLRAAGRRLLHLLGASSMVATGPGADLYLAELVGNVYLHPGGDDD
jgi:hypothetical protein